MTTHNLRPFQHPPGVYIDEHTAFTFTPDGRPRILARDGGTFDDPSSKLVYVECNKNCSDSANWSHPVRLLSTNSGSSVSTWSAATDSEGRIRATVYPRGGPFYYIWCNSNCTNADSWEGYSLDFGKDSGAYSSLALDAQGRPRVAYQDSVANLGYAWCDSGCEREGAKWTFVKKEDGNDILRDLNVPILPHCIKGGWFGGMRTELALDPHGNPRIGYDAEFKMECKRYPDDPNSKLTFIETKWWTSRFVFFPQPK